MNPGDLLLLYVVGLLSAIGGIAMLYELRRKRFEPTPTSDKIFRCRSCEFVYTDDPDTERSRCPQCGKTNDPIKF
jgi:predicted Zn-ribbon and HTH transcriptional regulator